MKLSRFCILIFVMLPIALFARDEFDSLLTQYSRQSDLSNETIQKSLGHVSVITREDIDALRLTTIADIFNYMRFTPYTENTRGLLDPKFSRSEAINESYVRVYIDNQAILSPYYGNGTQFFGKIKLNFIDHIEIYWGIPSFAFDEGTAYSVIKLYTKDPSRENANTINASVGSYGSYDLNGYSANVYDDFSYLLSIDRNKLKRKDRYEFANYPLKRGQEDSYIYTKFSIQNSHITATALESTYDNFTGNLYDFFTLKPTSNELKYKNLYLGYDYATDDESSKAYIGFSASKIAINENADPIDSNSTEITKYENVIHEQLLDTKFSQEFRSEHNILETGLRGRYKHYSNPISKINDSLSLIDTYGYNNEAIFSFYVEDKYLLTYTDLIVASVKQNFYLRDGEAKNSTGNGARAGYMHNGKLWFLKAFIYYSKDPRNFYQFQNFRYYYGKRKVEEKVAYSGEFGFNVNSSKISFSYGLTDVNRYKDSNHIRTKNYSATYEQKFNTFHRVKSSIWLSDEHLDELRSPDRVISKGGYVSLFDDFGKWNVANTINIQKQNGQKASYDLSSTITYKQSNRLNFYLKGENLLNKSAEISYRYGYYDENNNTVISRATFPQKDRMIYLGMEYTF